MIIHGAAKIVVKTFFFFFQLRFIITLEELTYGEDIANCPSCTLRIRVIYDEDKLPELKPPEEDQELSKELSSIQEINGDTPVVEEKESQPIALLPTDSASEDN